jgi:hypothetical protein
MRTTPKAWFFFARPPKPSLTAEVFNEGSGEGGLPPSEALFNCQSF